MSDQGGSGRLLRQVARLLVSRLCRDRPYGVRRGQMCQLVRKVLLGQLGMHCESEGEVLARVALGEGDVCRLAALGGAWTT